MIEYTKILECIKESIRTIPNTNGVSYSEIKKFIEANGSEDIEVILAGMDEVIFMNIFGIDAGSTLTSYPSMKDKLSSGTGLSHMARRIKFTTVLNANIRS